MFRFRLIPCLIVLFLASAAVSQAPYVRDFIELKERSTPPNDPSDGYSVIWRDSAGKTQFKANEASVITSGALGKSNGYAEINVDQAADALSPAANSSDWSNAVQIVSFNTDGLELNADADHTNDHLTGMDGVHKIDATINLFGADGDVWSAAIFKNNKATQLSSRNSFEMTAANSNSPITVSCLADLTATDTVEVWIQSESGGTAGQLNSAVLTAIKIGD